MDQIDRLVGQWEGERPDLDLRAMATIGRLLALGRHLDAALGELAAEYGIQPADADILFTLRRSGPPYRLTPSALSDSLLVSSGTMTSRLDRLERGGLIERVPHASDRRSMEVALTDRARELVDEAVTRHVDNEVRILAELSDRDVDELNRITSGLLARVASGAWRD